MMGVTIFSSLMPKVVKAMAGREERNVPASGSPRTCRLSERVEPHQPAAHQDLRNRHLSSCSVHLVFMTSIHLLNVIHKLLDWGI